MDSKPSYSENSRLSQGEICRGTSALDNTWVSAREGCVGVRWNYGRATLVVGEVAVNLGSEVIPGHPRSVRRGEEGRRYGGMGGKERG